MFVGFPILLSCINYASQLFGCYVIIIIIFFFYLPNYLTILSCERKNFIVPARLKSSTSPPG